MAGEPARCLRDGKEQKKTWFLKVDGGVLVTTNYLLVINHGNWKYPINEWFDGKISKKCRCSLPCLFD